MTDTSEKTYREHLNEFKNRALILEPHPYATHIELFFGLISPEYAAEINDTDTSGEFAVQDGKTKFHWQLQDDRPSGNPVCTKTFYSDVSNCYKDLKALNIRSSAVFAAINSIEGSKRVKSAVTAARAIWVEDDVKRQYLRSPKKFPLPPSFVVESSGGKYHYYWLTYTEELDSWDRLQKGVLVDLYDSDPNANGLNRAMRVPGFWHKKTTAFATKIVYMTGQDGLRHKPCMSSKARYINFGIDYTKLPGPLVGEKGDVCLFTIDDIPFVKRYSWEELVDNFTPEDTAVAASYGENLDYLDSSFDPVQAVENIIMSTDYHGSLLSLCLHFANFRPDEMYVGSLVRGLMQAVAPSARDERWQKRYNDVQRTAEAAVQKKVDEQFKENTTDFTVAQPSDEEPMDIDSPGWFLPFPDISGACVPLDRLLDNLAETIPASIKSFNYAMSLSLFSVILQNVPRMPLMQQRRANSTNLLLAQSTAGKDVNTRDPLLSIIAKLEPLLSSTDTRSKTILAGLKGASPSITSLAAFHKWATGTDANGNATSNKQYGSIWLDTEVTKAIKNMSSDNAGVAELVDIVIAIHDGGEIPSKFKANESFRDIGEGFSLLWATQPTVVKQHMTADLLAQGLFGRLDYYIADKLLNEDPVSGFLPEHRGPIVIDEEILDFLAYALSVTSKHVGQNTGDGRDTRGVVVFLDEEDWTRSEIPRTERNLPNTQAINDWFMEQKETYFNNIDSDLHIFIDRVMMSYERTITILGTIQHLYTAFKQGDPAPYESPIILNESFLRKLWPHALYQYEVRCTRIWQMINTGSGMDPDTRRVLVAVNAAIADSSWIQADKSKAKNAYLYLHRQKMVPLFAINKKLRGGVMRIAELKKHIEALVDVDCVMFFQTKTIDPNIHPRPLKKIVQLTVRGVIS